MVTVRQLRRLAVGCSIFLLFCSFECNLFVGDDDQVVEWVSQLSAPEPEPIPVD